MRENEVVESFGDLEQPGAFKNGMKIAEKYKDRTIYHEFLIDKIRQYQESHRGKLPSEFSQKNIKNYFERIQKKVETQQGFKVNEKVYEILLTAMQSHGMIEEMKKVPSRFKNYYITEAILNLDSDKKEAFYSNKVKELFNSLEERSTPLYTLCMIKALLKEGDTDAALRVLDDGERSTNARRQAVNNFYLKIYDHCFNEENQDVHQVAFLPDLLKEREQRMNQEIEAAAKISEYEKRKVIEKYKMANPTLKLPMSYSDFKLKHFNMVKTVNNYTKQMIIMKMIKSAIEDSDYSKINDFFTYLLVTKEEEQVVKSIRNSIEQFEKTYDPNRQPKSYQESKDPLRVLFKYFKNPNDDIDTLVGKFTAMVPSVKDRLDKLRRRKEHLHSNIKGMVKEKEALFLADSKIQKLKDLSLLEGYEKYNFDLASENNREAMDKMMQQYKRLMEPFTQNEEFFELKVEDVMKARKIHLDHPERSYNEILEEVNRENKDFAKLNNLDLQEKLQILIDAGDVATQENKEFSNTFVEKLKKGELKEFKQIIQKLRSQYQSVLSVPGQFGEQVNAESIVNGIIDKGIEESYTHTESDKLGHSKFINHNNGEVLYVDDARMASDSTYFVKTVADLAKFEMMNHSWRKNMAKSKENEAVSAMMKSREFRKYYYFMRKFYYQKFMSDIEEGTIKVDSDGNIQYGLKGQSDQERKNSNFQRQNERLISKVFQPPQFDIIDFKDYYDKSEYDTLVKEYYQSTRGVNKNDKLEFVKEKLFGEKLKEKAEKRIGKSLKTLYESIGMKSGEENSMYQLFKNIIPEDIASDSPTSQSEKKQRVKYLDEKYRSEFEKAWRDFKLIKYQDYEKSYVDKARNSGGFSENFVLPDPATVETISETLSEIKTIMDTVSAKDIEQSEEHVAFELFDTILDDDFESYKKGEDHEVFEDDGYEKGYSNQRQMGNSFKDIFVNDHPYIKKTLLSGDESSYRQVMKSLEEAKRSEKKTQKGSDSASDSSSIDASQLEFVKDSSLSTAQKSVLAHKTLEEFNKIALEEEERRKEIGEFEENRAIDYKHRVNVEESDKLEDALLNQTSPPSEASADYYDRFNKDFNLAGESDRWTDEYNIKKLSFEKSMGTMQEELKLAVMHKKEHSLQLAMELFDKIQNIQLSQVTTDLDSGLTDEYQKKVDEYEMFKKDQSLPEKLKSELEKLKLSLDDKTSPSFSLIKRYYKEGLVGLDEEKVKNVIHADLEDFTEASEKLESIYDELENKDRVMNAMQDSYDQGIDFYSRQSEKKVDYVKEKEERFENIIEKEIFDAYVEYQRDLLLQNDNYSPDLVKVDYTDMHKVKVIKQIFGVMEGKLLHNFGTDLLQFGIAHDIPDAVRIGENMAGLNDEDVPDHVKDKLREYILDNSAKLRERINVTGPMKGIVETHKRSTLSHSSSVYLPEKYDKMMAYDKYNRWRLPSVFANDYKKRGYLDEILGKDRLDALEEYVKN